MGTPAAFNSNLSLISCLNFNSDWSHVSFVSCSGIPSKQRLFRLERFSRFSILSSRNWTSPRSSWSLLSSRTSKSWETCPWVNSRLFFKSRTSFKRLSILFLVESMKVEKKTLIVSSWTFSQIFWQSLEVLDFHHLHSYWKFSQQRISSVCSPS